MYHQNLGSRRFTSLTWELLYETPRQFSGPPMSPGGFKSTRGRGEVRPTFVGRSSSRGSSRSTSSSASSTVAIGSRRKHMPMPVNATSKIAAAAFAQEKERLERKRQEKAEQQERGRRKERVSNATTINGDGAMHEVGLEDLKKELELDAGGSSPRQVHLEEEEGEGTTRDRKSSATLSIVLNEFEKEINEGRGRPAEADIEEYMENPESRIPNVPYKSVTHPDVAQPRTDSPVDGGNMMAVKPSWRKQPIEKFSAKTQKIKQKFDDRKTSITQKIPFLRNGSTMDRIKETFKFSRFSHRH
ncbi:hypothetical protein Dda_4831 [Drechslerella dactyloides]|uniref:Uncharacterized protein n=1 Tax=Drechslerella dactyloides TaxID=74499 RepID=A0AAD6NJQ9_DREDA|nr:hypothetical protein Dda_4831 [Drechslerella dactyloides]